MRVLVVEDEARMARLLRRALEEEGHAVDVAGDGPEGLWLATENHYAAIILDVMLPGKDGFAVATALRKAKNYVPVLMLTARGRPEERPVGDLPREPEQHRPHHPERDGNVLPGRVRDADGVEAEVRAGERDRLAREQALHRTVARALLQARERVLGDRTPTAGSGRACALGRDLDPVAQNPRSRLPYWPV